jgi:hypothetical protein
VVVVVLLKEACLFIGNEYYRREKRRAKKGGAASSTRMIWRWISFPKKAFFFYLSLPHSFPPSLPRSLSLSH